MSFFSRKTRLEAPREKAIGRRYESISEDLKYNLRNELSTITAVFEGEIDGDKKRKEYAKGIADLLERRDKLLAKLRDLYAQFYNDREKILDSNVRNAQYQIVKLMQSFDKEHREVNAQLEALAELYRELVGKLKVGFVFV